MDYESFVYLWFDSKNRKFYLGYHKGHEDDSYTHSSSVMESFSKQGVPSYMRRRILARGSCGEMLQLENDLLGNRKEKCWGKYYNVTVSFPPTPLRGEDSHFYIDGRSSNPDRLQKWYQENREQKGAYNKEYYEKNTEKVLEINKNYRENNRLKIRKKSRVNQRRYRERKKTENMNTATLEDFFG